MHHRGEEVAKVAIGAVGERHRPSRMHDLVDPGFYVDARPHEMEAAPSRPVVDSDLVRAGIEMVTNAPLASLSQIPLYGSLGSLTYANSFIFAAGDAAGGSRKIAAATAELATAK